MFGYTYQYVVQLRDTDAAGVIYFANLLAICHGAYESSLAAGGVDIKELVTNPPIALPIVHAHIDFKRPIHCGDRLRIFLEPERQSQSEFQVNYRIYLVDNQVAGFAVTKHVAIDVGSRHRVDLPLMIQAWLRGLNTES